MNGQPVFSEGENEPLFWVKAFITRAGEWIRSPLELLEDMTESIRVVLSAVITALQNGEAALIDIAGDTMVRTSGDATEVKDHVEHILDVISDTALGMLFVALELLLSGLELFFSVFEMFGIDSRELLEEFEYGRVCVGM